MRHLVDKYPCVRCGDGTVVRNMREIQTATCERCGRRQRLLWRIVHFEDAGRKAVESIPAGEVAYLRAWATCLFKYAEATALRLELLEVLTPHERALQLRIVHHRLEWSHKQVGKLKSYSGALADEAAAMELTVVSGGGEAPEMDRDAPVLKLVPRSGA